MVWQIVADELPEPQANKAHVKMLAAGVSFSEGLMRRGYYLGVSDVPFTPGCNMIG